MFALILNAEVYAPEPLGLRHILVCAGKIVYLGEVVPQLDAALGICTIDLQGQRLIPGLLDAHVHVTGGGGEAGLHTSVPPVPLTQFTRNGVTTVVGVLGTDDLVRTTGSLVARVRALRTEGLSAYCYTGGYHLPPTTLTGSVRADLVHIDCIVGMGELALSDHRSSQPTLDEVLRVASECHVAGLMTGKAGILHLHMGDGPRGLDLVRRALDTTELPPRVFNPTHVNRRKALFEEACALAVRGSTIDVSAFPVAEGEDAWSAAEALARYLDAGLPAERITVSSDCGGSLPVHDAQGNVVTMGYGTSHGLGETLRALLEAGRPLDQVLPPFTTNVALLLRLAHKGKIAVGADADLVVLDDEHQIRDVMARGVWHVRGGLPCVLGTFENNPQSTQAPATDAGKPEKS